MFELAAMISLIGAALIAPGWFVARKRHRPTAVLLLLPAAGVCLWFILVDSGIGSQSLSNLVELFGVAFVAVVAAYLKYFYFDRKIGNKSIGLAVTFLIIVAAAIAFRLFTPGLPE
jgi:cytochrome bd-type quinol oxidase subunit 2